MWIAETKTFALSLTRMIIKKGELITPQNIFDAYKMKGQVQVSHPVSNEMLMGQNTAVRAYDIVAEKMTEEDEVALEKKKQEEAALAKKNEEDMKLKASADAAAAPPPPPTQEKVPGMRGDRQPPTETVPQ